jgi:hypothetical protein
MPAEMHVKRAENSCFATKIPKLAKQGIFDADQGNIPPFG